MKFKQLQTVRMCRKIAFKLNFIMNSVHVVYYIDYQFDTYEN